MWWAPAIVEKAEISCIVKVQSYHIFFEGALVNGFFNGFQYIGRTIFCAYFFGELLVPLSPGNTNDQIDLQILVFFTDICLFVHVCSL